VTRRRVGTPEGPAKEPLAERAAHCHVARGMRQWAVNFWVAAAEREDAGRFIVRAHDMPTAFLELHAAIRRQLQLE